MSDTRWKLASTAMLASILLGCGGAQGTEPQDMSAADHRAAADAHDEAAAGHDAQYDPEAVDTRLPTGAAGGGQLYDWAEEVYNPTASHSTAAREHDDVAAQHRRAAATLEAFERQQCASFPPSTRALCPLLGQLASADDVDGGVRLVFREGVNSDAAHQHVACHVAFAGTQGREGMDHCPMYVPGARVERGEDGATLLVTDEAGAVSDLRHRAHAHLPEHS